MAITSCRSLLGTGLSSPSAIGFVAKPGRGLQNIGLKRLQDATQNCVMCYSKDNVTPDNVDKNVSKQGEKLAWLEGVSRGGVGAVLGIGIGAVCLALPAFADFLSYDHADLRGRDMSGQDLHGAVFAACDCRKINLKGSNLDGSTDTFAGFEGSNLQDSSWVRAFADRVVFRGANLENGIPAGIARAIPTRILYNFFPMLSGRSILHKDAMQHLICRNSLLFAANFTDAVLSGSQFDGADITGADFTDALIDNFQRLKMCKKAKGTNPSTGIETRDSLFC